MAAQRHRRGEGERVESPATAASRAQVRANRRNARRSTGPRTDAGKRVASRNAVTHGIFCADAVLPGEDPAAFTAFRNMLLDSPGLRPQTPLELSVVDPYVLARWRLRRTLAAEQVVHGGIAESLAEVARLPAEKLADLLRTREQLMAADCAPLADLDDDGYEYEDDDDEDGADEDAAAAARLARVEALMAPILAMAGQLPPAATLAASFTTEEHDGKFERLARYAHRLELDADRALRQLRQLRKDMGVDVANLPPCPYVEPGRAEGGEGVAGECDGEDDRADAHEERRDADRHQGDAGEDRDPTRVTRATLSGVSTSVDMSPPPRSRADAPRSAPVQNEPNLGDARAGDGAGAGYARASRRIDPITPAKLPPRGEGGSWHDGKDGAHQR